MNFSSFESGHRNFPNKKRKFGNRQKGKNEDDENVKDGKLLFFDSVLLWCWWEKNSMKKNFLRRKFYK